MKDVVFLMVEVFSTFEVSLVASEVVNGFDLCPVGNVVMSLFLSEGD